MDWIPSEIVEAMRGSHQLGIFVRIGTDPALHLWLGTYDIPAGFDSVDEDGTVYLGGGPLLGVPTLESLVNGTSEAVEFSLSGVDADTGRKLLADLPAVRGASVSVGITTLDQYYQPMSRIISIWEGTAAYTSETSPITADGENRTITISLSVQGGDATRSRGARSLWTSAHQVKFAGLALAYKEVLVGSDKVWEIDDTINPDMAPDAYDGDGHPLYHDRACDATPRLARGVQPVWPNF